MNKLCSSGAIKSVISCCRHFLSFATVAWVDVLTLNLFVDSVPDSLRYLQLNRGLAIQGCCGMPNHLHLICKANNSDLRALLRHFKKFTAKQVVAAIETSKQEGRRDWMLPLYKAAGEANVRNSNYQFWQHSLSAHRRNSQPRELFGPTFMVQKLEYIHQNPVAAGLVWRPEHYRLSGAVD